MQEDLCREKHRRIDERIETQDRRINNHSGRIDSLEQDRSRTDEKIISLCEQIKSLVTTIRWGVGLTLSSLVAFFIWYVQQIGA